MRRGFSLGTVAVATVLAVCFSGVASATSLAPGTPFVEDFVLGGTVPGKWGAPAFGTPALVSWSLMPGTGELGDGFSSPVGPITALAAFMPAGFHAAITAAFASWTVGTGLTFIEVADSGLDWNDPLAVSGDIRLGGEVFDGPGGVLAHGFFPPANGSTAAGDIHFDIAELWKLGFGGAGFDIEWVAAHEIGHAIGLEHTAVPASLMNPFYTEGFSGPQADDIAGATFIYGPGGTTPPIPEPATMTLLGLGLVGLAYRRKRAA